MNAPLPQGVTGRVDKLLALSEQSVGIQSIRDLVEIRLSSPGGAMLSDCYEGVLGLLDRAEGRISRRAVVCMIEAAHTSQLQAAAAGDAALVLSLTDQICGLRHRLE